MEQRSEAWFAAKAGKFSASEMADLLSGGGKKITATRSNLIARKVAERLTGVMEQGYTSAAMQHGIDHEDDARNLYFVSRELPIDEEGFIDHPSIPYSGCSPDGMVSDDGLVEIKCPNTATHIEYLRTKKVPNKYLYQMQWQMACTGRKWCDFVSYDPRMPTRLQLLIIHVPRDDELIATLEDAVNKGVKEVEEIISELSEVSDG
jgi:putative phage-type endonuclease